MPSSRIFSFCDELLAELGLSVNLAAAILDVRRATLSDLVNGNASLSPEMALRIEKAFGVDMEMLLRMQAPSCPSVPPPPEKSSFA